MVPGLLDHEGEDDVLGEPRVVPVVTKGLEGVHLVGREEEDVLPLLMGHDGVFPTCGQRHFWRDGFLVGHGAFSAGEAGGGEDGKEQEGDEVHGGFVLVVNVAPGGV